MSITTMPAVKGLSSDARLVKRDMERMGDKRTPLTKIAPDEGTDLSSRKRQVIWRNFVIQDPTTANAMVLCPEHPDYKEGQEAAMENTKKIFDQELSARRDEGMEVMALATHHQHYFGSGGGFEKICGKRLTPFLRENYEYDEEKGTAKLSTETSLKMRRIERRQIKEEFAEVWEEKEQAKVDAVKNKKRKISQMEQEIKQASQNADNAIDPNDPWGASVAIMHKRGGPMGVDDFRD